jgi:hypothetical protein
MNARTETLHFLNGAKRMIGRVLQGGRYSFLLCSAWLPKLILSPVCGGYSQAMDETRLIKLHVIQAAQGVAWDLS